MQSLFVDENAASFHLREDFGQRQFNFCVKFRQIRVGKSCFVNFGEFFQRSRGCGKGIIRHRQPVELQRQKSFAGIIIRFRIEQIGGKLHVENSFKPRNGEVAQKIFQPAQNYLAGEFIEDFLHVGKA